MTWPARRADERSENGGRSGAGTQRAWPTWRRRVRHRGRCDGDRRRWTIRPAQPVRRCSTRSSCRRIKTEFDALGASGIREIMTKGPEWAKSNVTKERMEQIRRYLVLEEDVRFRCPLGKARPELEAAESEAGATTPLQPNEAVPGATRPTPAPAAKPARKAKSAAVVREADPAIASAATQNGETTAGAKSPPRQRRPAPKPGRRCPETEAQHCGGGTVRRRDVAARSKNAALTLLASALVRFGIVRACRPRDRVVCWATARRRPA